MQLFIPVYGIFNFIHQRDYFACFFCFGWLSTNCFSIAAYVADARSQTMPLVTLGGGKARHDWNYLLSQVGWLEYDIMISHMWQIFAWMSMGICLIGGLWLILRMENIIFISPRLAAQRSRTNRLN